MGVPKQMPHVGRGKNSDSKSNLYGIQAWRCRPNQRIDMTATLKAAWPQHGGKSDIAAVVWARLGDTPNYVEPMCGTAAVLLGRPHDLDGKTETLNDYDGHISNVLRSITYSPDETAAWCDMPVSEVELTAWHLHLKAAREELTARLMADPFYHDPMLAGAWLYGVASWIGDGWCVADGPWVIVDGKLCDRRTMGASGAGVPRQMPKMDHESTPLQSYRNAPGVPKKMPVVGAGNVAGGGYAFDQGVQYQRRTSPAALLAYFDRLASRLRRVRILCGDWRRVVKPSITTNHGLTAMFMDPPYPAAEHDMGYHGDNNIWHTAARWAVENGDNPLLRIAVCGYWSEQTDALFPATWERYRWEARGGYSNQSKDGRGRSNAKREAIFFSPNCIDAKQAYGPLFEGL